MRHKSEVIKRKMSSENTSKDESSHEENEIIQIDSDSDSGEEGYSLSKEDLRDDDGSLSALLDEFRDLQEGKYVVKVEAAGFKTYESAAGKFSTPVNKNIVVSLDK